MKTLTFIALLSLGFTCNDEKPNTKVTNTEATKTEVINEEVTDAEITDADVNEAGVTYVYICVSAGAKRYHLKQNCRGLDNCRHEIRKIKLESAKENGKTLCGWEK